MNVRRLAGDLRFDRGSIRARDVAIETDRTKLVTAISYSGPDRNGCSTSTLDAERLSLPEIGRYFRPLAAIKLEPAVNVKAHGTLDALNMDVNVVSSAGTARGPLVGHFGSGRRARRAARRAQRRHGADSQRAEWKTRVTGQADFKWTFSPAEIDFKFAGPQVKGFGYQAANVRAQGVYEVPRLADGRAGQAVLRFDASGAAYGATATTRATF